jgi:hypothetical protein
MTCLTNKEHFTQGELQYLKKESSTTGISRAVSVYNTSSQFLVICWLKELGNSKIKAMATHFSKMLPDDEQKMLIK